MTNYARCYIRYRWHVFSEKGSYGIETATAKQDGRLLWRSEFNKQLKSSQLFTRSYSLRIFVYFEYFSLRCRVFGQYSYPFCFSESLLYSPTDKAPVQMLGFHGSLCWSYCATSLCRIHPTRWCCENQLYISKHCHQRKQRFQLHSMWSLHVHIHRHKCGQAFRFGARHTL